MFTYTSSHTAPHVYVEAAEVVSADEVHEALQPMIDDFPDQPDGFVVLAHYTDVVMFEADAVEALFYYVARLFDAEPSLLVFSSGGEAKHEGMREFIQQLDFEGSVHFPATREEANAIIDAHVVEQEVE